MPSIAIQLKSLDATELEEFTELFAEKIEESYLEVHRLADAHDKGRDVIGFLTMQKHEGDWDLFQCKRKTFGSALKEPEALAELGKVFYYHTKGTYATLPRRFVFVAPRGVIGSLQDLIFNPSQFKGALLQGWEKHCARSIVSGKRIALDDGLIRAIDGYDFGRVERLAVSDIVKHPAAKLALSRVLGLPVEDPPPGEPPREIQPEELPFLTQLQGVYDEHRADRYRDVSEVLADEVHGEDMTIQRKRYFAAAWFERNYRDSTRPDAFVAFRDDVYHGSREVHRRDHGSLMARLGAVMQSAAQVPAGFGGSPTRSYVRQGVWHQFVNEGRERWHP